MPKKSIFITRKRRGPTPSQPHPPAAPATSAPAAEPPLPRGPESVPDPGAFLTDLAASPPVDEIRADQIRAMTAVADRLLAEHTRRRAAAEAQGDDQAAEKARQTIQDLDEARTRWSDFYGSQEFADVVRTVWADLVGQNAGTWPQQTRDDLDAPPPGGRRIPTGGTGAAAPPQQGQEAQQEAYREAAYRALAEVFEQLRGELGTAAAAPQRGGRGRKRRGGTPSANKVYPLTERQLDALHIVGECKGNIAEAARRLRKDRTTVRQHYRVAMRKLGRRAQEYQTQRLPMDRRGQLHASKADDLRG